MTLIAGTFLTVSKLPQLVAVFNAWKCLLKNYYIISQNETHYCMDTVSGWVFGKVALSTERLSIGVSILERNLGK